MKIVLEEDQSAFENENYINGLQFVSSDDDVFVQIGNLSIRVNKEELQKVLKVF